MERPTGTVGPAPRLTAVAAPSGVGRRRVIALVRAHVPELTVPVPITTRSRRAQETDGDEYVFLPRAEFARRRAAGDLLEWTELAGRWYGTARTPVTTALCQGRPVLVGIDPAGARQIHRSIPGARLVYLAPLWDRDTAEQPPPEFDVTIVTDTVARAAEELVSLVGSPAVSDSGCET